MPESQENTENVPAPQEESTPLGSRAAGANYSSGRIQNPDVILSRLGVFDALDELFKDTGIPRGSKQAMQWFKELTRELFEQTDLSPEESVLHDKTRMMQKSGYKREGSMYLFNYFPKTKSKLKYYDMFPLVFILKFTKDGFLGLNLHYLPPSLRERFYTLMRTKVRGSIDNKWTRMHITYELLKKNKSFRYYRPCIKRYKTKYIGSRILHIYPKDWDFAIHLPIERFKKSVKQAVWMESRQKIIQNIEGSAEQ